MNPWLSSVASISAVRVDYRVDDDDGAVEERFNSSSLSRSQVVQHQDCRLRSPRLVSVHGVVKVHDDRHPLDLFVADSSGTVGETKIFQSDVIEMCVIFRGGHDGIDERPVFVIATLSTIPLNTSQIAPEWKPEKTIWAGASANSMANSMNSSDVKWAGMTAVDHNPTATTMAPAVRTETGSNTPIAGAKTSNATPGTTASAAIRYAGRKFTDTLVFVASLPGFGGDHFDFNQQVRPRQSGNKQQGRSRTLFAEILGLDFAIGLQVCGISKELGDLDHIADP